MANQAGGPSDLHKLFKPSSNPGPATIIQPSPSSPSPNLQPYATPSPSSSSSSYPPPTGPLPFHTHYLPYQPQPQPLPISYQTSQQQPHLPSPSPNSGARLMALLTTPSNPPMPFPATAPPEFSMPTTTPINLVTPQPPPLRLLSNKFPKGRHLIGDRVVYDVDVRLQGEVQPQLEVTPITKYVSDPGLVVGRQIAVNRTYICYGLKLGNIRVLNINTALRALLRGHTQRVTDMAFFAEDVPLLASASIDGLVFIWRINEGPNEDDKAHITGKIVIAIQIVGGGASVHPRVCWHSHKQEILVVAIGNRILKIDSTKVGKGEVFSAEEPLKCPIDKLIDGVQFVGKHDGEVTELSMCQWMTTRLASASTDGTANQGK